MSVPCEASPVTGETEIGQVAGWYPDPWWTGSMRYWDGQQWTPSAVWGSEPPPPPLPPLSVLRSPAFWVVLAGTIACVAGGRVLGDAVGRHITTLTAAETLNWAFYIVVYGGLSLLVVQVCRRFGTGSLRADLGLELRWSDLGWGPLLFVGTRIAQVLVTAPLIASSVGVRHSSEVYSRSMRHEPLAALITLAVVGIVVAPLVEELLFRGVLLRSLLPIVGPAGAAIVQGVLFGLYHFSPDLGLYNVVLLVANGTFGIIFGFVALRRRSLGTGIVAHALTNATALVVVFASR